MVIPEEHKDLVVEHVSPAVGSHCSPLSFPLPIPSPPLHFSYLFSSSLAILKLLPKAGSFAH